MVRETVDEDEAFSEKAVSNQHSAISERQNQQQNQRPFTAKDAQPPQQAKTGLAGDPGDAKKNQGLPLRNTDNNDFGEAGGEFGGGDVEFVPVPGGYGFQRVRLRIEPELGAERRPVQAKSGPVGQPGAGPHEHAQAHAILR
jgi:hypothetical protein